MATLTIRLDDEARDALEELARTNGVNLSSLLREQVDVLLGRGVPMKRADVPRSLSMAERCLLALHHETLAILKAGDEHEAEYHANMATVLRAGYTAEYEDAFAGIDVELSRTECRLVWDILDMYRVLDAAIRELSESERAELGDVAIGRLRFMGFDLNDPLEGRMLFYVRYLVQTDRWTELAERLDAIGDRGNAHHRCLPRYETMLSVYTPIYEDRLRRRGFSVDVWRFSVDELRQIIDSTARGVTAPTAEAGP